MAKNGSGVLIFAAGLVLGGFAVWKLCKGRYERIAREEIDSVKAAFARAKKCPGCENEKKPEHAETEGSGTAGTAPVGKHVTEDGSVLTDMLRKTGYIPNKEEPTERDRPYLISPEEFGEFYDYNKSSLTFFADGVLTDENYDIVDDIEGTVGIEALSQFGAYEDDAVHIRNDARRSDYEILLDTRRYEDILRTMPPLPVEA